MRTTDKSQERLTHAGPEAPRSLTLRAVLLGVLAVPMNVYLAIQTETVWTTQYPTTMTIIFNAVATLLFFSLLNLFLREAKDRLFDRLGTTTILHTNLL